MNWKIERDIYYRDLSEKERDEAGFFFDSNKENIRLGDTLEEKITPVQWIKNRTYHTSKVAILSISGAFAPFHKGHLEALVAARKRLLRDYDEVFAFISPDHDEYIGFKAHSGFAIDERIHEIRKQIEQYDWIRLDLWPALCCSGSINLTDGVRRLELYIKKHYKHFPVFYVAGGDNARFALAFKNKGNCVIVNRPGSEKAFKKYSYLVDDKRIVFAEGSVNISSTELRSSYRSNFYNPTHLILRVDTRMPIEWRMAEVIRSFFDTSEVVTVDEQEKLFKKIEGDVISLDPLIKGKYNYEVSRHYDFGGMDRIWMEARPEAPKLFEQERLIPKGIYTLYDDDIYSGETMKWVQTRLSHSGISIKKQISFVQGAAGVEVLDARDFIWGSGGLVINGKREIYSLPNVVPSVRCSVKNSKKFSEAIKDFNFDLTGVEL